ncbi:MAG: hypothetical protein KatS3mg129_1394 [Leptospiraceae bacterium]|nr:MAG: hypothetical protein KatS3mg129_1394 [Leptospiraceae bacterium]
MHRNFFIIFIIILLLSCKIEIIEPSSERENLSPIDLYLILDMLLNPIPPEPNVDGIGYKIINNSGSDQIISYYITIDNEPACSLKIINRKTNIKQNETTNLTFITFFHNAIKEFYIGIESLSLCSNPMTFNPDRASKYDCEITTSAINCVKMD